MLSTMLKLSLSLVCLMYQSEAAKNLDLVTLNMELFSPSLDPRLERLPLMVQEVINSDADGVCLQEVWFSSDMADIVSRLKEQFPYSFSSIHLPNGELPGPPGVPICPASKLVPWTDCLRKFCSNITNNADVYECQATFCPDVLMKVSVACKLCLYQANLRVGSVCLYDPTVAMNTYGTLFLSKRAIVEAELVKFEEDVADDDKNHVKGMLEMKLENVIGPVACSFLTLKYDYSKFMFEPNLPQYATHKDRNFGQVQEILNRYANESNVIMLGSFGTGPRYKRRIDPSFPKSYKLIENAVPALKRSSNKRATYFGNDAATSVNHVFVRGHILRASRRRPIRPDLSEHSIMWSRIRLAK